STKPTNIMPTKPMKTKSFTPSLINESRSLTPPTLPPKPLGLRPMEHSASAPSFIDLDEYWASYFSRSSGRSMKRSWGFLIARQYNYQFENFYAVVIQRAYRDYKKRPESLAKRVWET
ncbi:8433_t:CDS:2, partial [Acaulospora morrowiae]